MILRKFTRDHPKMIEPRLGVMQMPVVLMQPPPEPAEVAFYEELLGALGLPLVGEVSRIRARRMARDALRGEWKISGQTDAVSGNRSFRRQGRAIVEWVLKLEMRIAWRSFSKSGYYTNLAALSAGSRGSLVSACAVSSSEYVGSTFLSAM